MAQLSFYNFRHPEERPVRVGRTGQRNTVRQRFPQALVNVLAAGIGNGSTKIRHLRHRLHVCRIQFTQVINVIENRVQIAQKMDTLFLRQFHVSQVRYVNNIFLVDLHVNGCCHNSRVRMFEPPCR